MSKKITKALQDNDLDLDGMSFEELCKLKLVMLMINNEVDKKLNEKCKEEPNK